MRARKSVISEPYISTISIQDKKPERKGKMAILGQQRQAVFNVGTWTKVALSEAKTCLAGSPARQDTNRKGFYQD